MRRKRTALAMAAVGAILGCAAVARSAQPARTVTVSAGETAYREAPVWVPIEASPGAASAEMQEVGGAAVPCQLVRSGGEAWVVFLVRDLAAGQSRQYRLELSEQAAAAAPGSGVEVTPESEAVTVNVDGELFTRYWFAGAPKPYCYPVHAPGGLAVTRNYPMKEVAGESTDHPHQRSFWFAFGEVNGIDFWTEGERCGRIVHREFEALQGGPVVGIIRARGDWVAPDGGKVCEEVRELRVYRAEQGRLVDFSITLLAAGAPVHFGDTKEGMFAFRVASSMEVMRGGGHIVNSEGITDAEAWGKRAAWCDYSGAVDGQTAGIAIFDHPQNFRHPTFWHARPYGLFAANPFGLRHFLGPEHADEGLRLEPGESLTFRYRVWIHRGAAAPSEIAAMYAQYAQPPQVTVR